MDDFDKLIAIAIALFLGYEVYTSFFKKNEETPPQKTEQVMADEEPTMFEIMLKKAQKGDAKAQNNVAAYYKNAGDCKSAYYWYQKAVNQGDPLALYGMGQCYATGCGTKKDYTIAANYFRRAADKGVRDAALVLAEMYERGLGVEQSYYNAAYWRRVANSR